MPAFRTDWDTAPNPSYDVWTVTNGGEVVPGVLCPFTATMLTALEADALPKLVGAYPTGKRLRIHRPPIGNFFGVTAGRLTLNVGFSVAAMSMLDPDIGAAMAAQFFQGSDDAKRFIVTAPAAEVAGARAVADEQRRTAEAATLESQQSLYVERLSDQIEVDRRLPLKAAWKRYCELADANVELLNRHLVVSTAAGEMQVRLAGLIAVAGGDPTTIVGLCSGLGAVESSKPALALFQLAQAAKRSAGVRKLIMSGNTIAVAAHLADPPDAAWLAFADEFDEFIFRYGFRVQGEADPTVADWSENPTFVISQVRSMMALAASESPHAHVKRAETARHRLERTVRAALPRDFREPFDSAASDAQRFTAMRELTKAVWVLATRRQRAPLLAVADGLVAAGRIRRADDYRWCTHAEVATMARGREVPHLAESITRRKRQSKQAETYSLPDSWIGTVTPTRQAEVSANKKLTGIGVSAGIAEGPARIILNTEAAFAREIAPGDILVAPFTDTPWTPLFIPAGAVVVETGGMLSHAATVAREFGIPCVVLVHDATRIIRDGDVVRVDGTTGTVNIVRRAKTR